MSLRTFNNGDRLLNVRESITNNFDELFARINAVESALNSPGTPKIPINFTVNSSNSNINVYPTNSYYFTIDQTLPTFKLQIGGIDGVTFTNVYTPSDFSTCKLTIATTPVISSNKAEVFVTDSCTLSTINGDLFTFYYYNTGSLIAGFSPASVALASPLIQLCPLTALCVTVTDTPEVTGTNGLPLGYNRDIRKTYYNKPAGAGAMWLGTDIQEYNWDIPNDWPLSLKGDATSGYYWQWFHGPGIFRSQTFPNGVCPTSVDKGGLCVYTLTNLKPSMSAEYIGSTLSVGSDACQPPCNLSTVKVSITGHPTDTTGEFVDSIYSDQNPFTPNLNLGPDTIQEYNTISSGGVVSDFPLYGEFVSGRGYRWLYGVDNATAITFPGAVKALKTSQWFTTPVCPTSVDKGGLCVYTSPNAAIYAANPGTFPHQEKYVLRTLSVE